jgi:two-component system chemotaxis sensor kinase CheA
LTVGRRELAIAYTPILAPSSTAEATLDKVMLVISDVTEELERQRLEAGQRELLSMFNRLVHDRRGVIELIEEGDALIERIAAPQRDRLVSLRRDLHTLKGNAGIFGLGTLAAACHDLEGVIQETNELPPPNAVRGLVERWRALRTSLDSLLGDGAVTSLEVDDESLRRLLSAIRAGSPADELVAELESWRLEPTALRLERIGDQARRIATRLGKLGLDVVVEHNRVRLAPEPWAGFWAAFIHVVRNAVVHGIEPSAVRASAGKPAHARIRLASYIDDAELVIAIEDDGPGIDLDAVATAAGTLGLAPRDRGELLQAIFHDGVTTTANVSELSGRGIGMGAVQAACAAMGGRTVVASEPGHFTRIEFRFPAAAQSHRVGHAA